MNKSSLRRAVTLKRKNLTARQIAQRSQIITSHINSSALWLEAKHIALYLPFNGEVDLSELLKASDKQLYLPSIDQHKMQFHAYHDKITLQLNRFGIKQPDFIHDMKQPPLDLCLMPLLGFDLNGNRLGMGGGFYDRYFENNHSTILAGVGYQFQQYDQLPADPWDVKLQHLFTEQGHISL